MHRRILVPFDGSATSERGLLEAIRMAHAHEGRLVLLHLIDDFPTLREFASIATLDKIEARRRQAGQALLDTAASTVKHAQVSVEGHLLFTRDTLADTIVEQARQLRCDLIVMGTHGRSGVARAVIGSVAEGVARHSAVPVLLVPPTAQA